MPGIKDIREKILSGSLDEALLPVYGEDAPRQRVRLAGLVESFQKTFGEREISLFSVPGRTEVTGNHTDHNRGAVLAAAINLDIIAAASKRDDTLVNLHSEGFEPDHVDISRTKPVESEKESSKALIRGIAARLAELGYLVGGFDCVTTSEVFKGSGLSSSAAFEVMIATIFNHLYNNGSIDPITLALVSAYAENNYFGKPSGLMDQTTCAAGGFAMIDFKDPSAPLLEKIDFDFAATGHTICAVGTGSSHVDLTSDYASMPVEMRRAAEAMGKKHLREVDEDEFYKNLPLVRERAGDRAALRAIHFFSEHKRVLLQREALKADDFALFLKTIRQSGLSSFMYLQNVSAPGDSAFQPLALALAMTDRFLGERGAFRVHGGGFAGMIMAFVPNELTDDYTAFMEPVFGKGSVKRLSVRRQGPVKLA